MIHIKKLFSYPSVIFGIFILIDVFSTAVLGVGKEISCLCPKGVLCRCVSGMMINERLEIIFGLRCLCCLTLIIILVKSLKKTELLPKLRPWRISLIYMYSLLRIADFIIRFVTRDPL